MESRGWFQRGLIMLDYKYCRLIELNTTSSVVLFGMETFELGEDRLDSGLTRESVLLFYLCF